MNPLLRGGQSPPRAFCPSPNRSPAPTASRWPPARRSCAGGGGSRSRATNTCRRPGPVLVVGNHDSHWDPVAIGIAGRKRRQIRALAKASLWDIKPASRRSSTAWVRSRFSAARRRGRALHGDRTPPSRSVHWRVPGGNDLARRGAPRPQRSWPPGTRRPRSQDRLVPVTGTVDIVRFPKRPRIRVEFFEPARAGLDGEDAARSPYGLRPRSGARPDRPVGPAEQGCRKRREASRRKSRRRGGPRERLRVFRRLGPSLEPAPKERARGALSVPNA